MYEDQTYETILERMLDRVPDKFDKREGYRILSKEEVEHLAESIGEDRFAVFSKNAQGENLNGQYNVVFKEDDTEEIETALKNPRTTKRKI